jgi:glutaredoxin-like protein NrdH
MWRTAVATDEGAIMKIHLYALSTCPYCRMTRKYLDENNVDYELTEVDLLEGSPNDESTPKGAAAAEVKRISGGTSFPVLVAGDQVVVGFNKSRIAQLLGLPA